MTLDVIPQTYLKSISGVPGLFEIRVEDQEKHLPDLLLYG